MENSNTANKAIDDTSTNNTNNHSLSNSMINEIEPPPVLSTISTGATGAGAVGAGAGGSGGEEEEDEEDKGNGGLVDDEKSKRSLLIATQSDHLNNNNTNNNQLNLHLNVNLNPNSNSNSNNRTSNLFISPITPSPPSSTISNKRNTPGNAQNAIISSKSVEESNPLKATTSNSNNYNNNNNSLGTSNNSTHYNYYNGSSPSNQGRIKGTTGNGAEFEGSPSVGGTPVLKSRNRRLTFNNASEINGNNNPEINVNGTSVLESVPSFVQPVLVNNNNNANNNNANLAASFLSPINQIQQNHLNNVLNNLPVNSNNNFSPNNNSSLNSNNNNNNNDSPSSTFHSSPAALVTAFAMNHHLQADGVWTSICEKVFPLFNGEAFLSSKGGQKIELLNQMVRVLLERWPQSLLFEKIRELIQDGISMLKIKLETINNSNASSNNSASTTTSAIASASGSSFLIKLSSLWSFFSSHILPYLQGIFLPLAQSISEFNANNNVNNTGASVIGAITQTGSSRRSKGSNSVSNNAAFLFNNNINVSSPGSVKSIAGGSNHLKTLSTTNINNTINNNTSGISTFSSSSFTNSNGSFIFKKMILMEFKNIILTSGNLEILININNQKSGTTNNNNGTNTPHSNAHSNAHSNTHSNTHSHTHSHSSPSIELHSINRVIQMLCIISVNSGTSSCYEFNSSGGVVNPFIPINNTSNSHHYQSTNTTTSNNTISSLNAQIELAINSLKKLSNTKLLMHHQQQQLQQQQMQSLNSSNNVNNNSGSVAASYNNSTNTSSSLNNIFLNNNTGSSANSLASAKLY